MARKNKIILSLLLAIIILSATSLLYSKTIKSNITKDDEMELTAVVPYTNEEENILDKEEIGSSIETEKNNSEVDSAYEIPEVKEDNSKVDIGENAIKKDILINVPLIDQNPELYNGCEITSATMLMNYIGINVTKMEMAQELAKDTTYATRGNDGNIAIWGDPKIGFVGNITGNNGGGITVDPEPVIDVMNNYIDNPVNLTGSSIYELKTYLSQEKPVVVWVTIDFIDPELMSWTTPAGREVTSSFDIHGVVLTGYDEENMYYNDPLTVSKNESISIERFIYIWNKMGSKAISYIENPQAN